jgi:chromosomal replication initiation ATPase DnaA
MAGQIALPLGPLGRREPSRIIVGTANMAAIEACQQTDTWPFRTAILFGPARSGKSLLANWFTQGGYGEAVDDADRMDETELFHRWNRSQETGIPLLLTAAARGEGQTWDVTLPDLGTRLRAALRLEIGTPDDIMFEELIGVHAEGRALALTDEACRYLASRSERSHLGAEQLVATIDRLSLERKSAPGPAIWREALEEMADPNAHS